MDITLGDLMTLEPRLNADREALDMREPSPLLIAATVSWAVTARATPPHLPLLRGGEVLLVPARVTAVVAGELPALIREGILREVSAIVFARDDPALDSTPAPGDDVSILWWTEQIAAETETAINRLLTECRGNLYHIGSELERHMADAAANHTGVEAVVRTAARITGLPLIVFDAHGRRIAAAPEDVPLSDASDITPGHALFQRGLPLGATLVLGPAPPDQSVVARFLVDRIAAAAAAAIQRDDAARPRGIRRAEAAAALLAGRYSSASDQRAAALALGLDPDAVFFVAVSDHLGEPAMTRALAPLGSAHPAGGFNGRQTILVAATGQPAAEILAGRVREVKRQWEAQQGRDGLSLALSAPAVGVASIPAAAREARFVADMQSEPDFPRRAASFSSVDDVGAMGLLFQLRDSDELRRFISEALGPLQTRDQRGSLKATLRAFLESGGSHAHASQRLGIHRNTLAYRLRRIGELVGRDVTDPGSWLTLHLALCAAEMLETCSEER